MKKRILFIDDESNFLEGLKHMLHGQCNVWDMYFTHSVDAALDEISKIAFDAVISDVTMPGKDAFVNVAELFDSIHSQLSDDASRSETISSSHEKQEMFL